MVEMPGIQPLRFFNTQVMAAWSLAMACVYGDVNESVSCCPGGCLFGDHQSFPGFKGIFPIPAQDLIFFHDKPFYDI
jgi:hypothetical protein